MTFHDKKDILEKARWYGDFETIRTVCGQTIKQKNTHDESDTNCPRCLEARFPKKQVKSKALRFTCFYCNESFPLNEHEIEHKIPLSRGGTNLISNLVDSCKKCNRIKGDRTAQEFLRTFK
jgi:5-methylcytosine-specific restriction endonuclease McrA